MGEHMAMNALSRRSTRLFDGEQNNSEKGPANQEPIERGDEGRDTRRSSCVSIEACLMPRVNLGRDLTGLLPSTMEEMGKQVTKALQDAKSSNKNKIDARPLNFGIVMPGIYRSSLPLDADFAYLESLGLKTVLSLVKKDDDPRHQAFRQFTKGVGVRHEVLDMKGTKKEEIPAATMRLIIKTVLDKDNHPILIHCNHGKHRTGCAVAVIRHVTGWQVNSIIEEYSSYAEPKVRDVDVKYITEYQVTSLEGIFHQRRISRRGQVLTSRKMLRLLVFSAIALFVWLNTPFVIFFQ